jgi:YHS domain-containing protein
MGSESLSQRIKAEFDGSAQRAKSTQQSREKESKDREARLSQFAKTCEDLKSVWRPRLEEFAKQFGEKIKVTPTLTPSLREAKVNFLTELATVTLVIRVSASPDVSKLILDYDLLIIPVYFEYERNARLEMPLDKIDRDAVGRWIDDRLVACVKAYLSVQENEYYLRRAMVEDPITKAQFMPQDAAAKLDHEGRTIYFASDETFRQYKEKLQIKS